MENTMRHLLLALLLTFSFGAAAKPAKPDPKPEYVKKEVLCFAGQEVFKRVRDKFGEVPVFVGKHKYGGIAVFYNRTTRTYTVFEFNDVTTCAISTGEDAELLEAEPVPTKNAM
jgi:hypothetical protein